MAGLATVIATCRTAKHRIFTFVSADHILDAKIVGIGLSSPFELGILSSRIHLAWALRTGGWLGVGNDSNYNHSDCFGKFPFPSHVSGTLGDRISAEAHALDRLRKRVLSEHADLTLTKLYNVLEALRIGRTLTDTERDIHDRGLVSLIRQHHDAIDALVAEAYGWPADTSDEDIVTHLVALNKERAAEEARGLVRYLRPEYQDSGYQPPATDQFDLGVSPVAPVSNVIPWPASLPEQVGAIRTILVATPWPTTAQEIARNFSGKRAASVRPVLDALTGLGLARRLLDGRYAA
jgi:hypothetical protein